MLGDLIPVDRVTAGISNQPTIKFDTLWVRCHQCGRPLTALLNQDGGHPAVGTVGKIAARMRAERIVLFTGLWIFSFHGQESPSAELGTDARRMLLSDRTHTPKKKRATSHGTCKLHYSTPYEVESDTLIFGYWPLPGKSHVATDRLRKASHAKDSFQRPLGLCHDLSGQMSMSAHRLGLRLAAGLYTHSTFASADDRRII